MGRLSNLSDVLNEEQARAAGKIEGPMLVIAGAGSGKTRMMTYRIAYMLENGIAGENILALTFTNKAAREMKERVESVIGKKAGDVTLTTFHSFGLMILKKYIHLLGYHNDFSLYDQGDNESLVKDSIIALGYQVKDYMIPRLLSYFSDFKTGRMKLDGEKDSAVKEIYNEWLLSQKAYNVVDFDDLIVLPVRLFEEKKFVLEKVQERFKYILVDEFQDTSILQYRMLSLIAKKYRNIAVVGDDDQSIYSWRGANYRNIELFEEDFPELVEYKLERNYRSTKTILDAANAIISHNEKRKDKKLWTDSKKGALIYLRHHETGDAEASFIASDIKVELRKGYSSKDIGILVRTNSLIQQIEEKLLEARFPHKISGGKSFYDRKEIRDILSYLKFITNTLDDSALLRIINTPRRGIGRTTVERLRKKSEKENISLYEAFTESLNDEKIQERIRNSMKNFLQRIESWKNSLGRRDIIDEIAREIAYRNMLVEEYPENENIVEYKMKGISFLSERYKSYIERNPGEGLKDYLNVISLVTDDDGDDEKKVSLMTMHAAKGLEFSVVYIAGADDSIIPSRKALEEDKDNIDEERRLFYVAITRAKDILIINTARERVNYQGEMTTSLPSRFIEEIPRELFQDEKELEEEDKKESINSLRSLLEKYKK